MSKKFELTTYERDSYGKPVYRIRALRTFQSLRQRRREFFVREGVLGGFVESEDNLSHDGECWISENAEIKGNAIVSENAFVHGNATIKDQAKVYGNAEVFGEAVVYKDAQIYGNAIISCYALIYDNAKVFDRGCVSHNAWIGGNSEIFGYSHVYGDASVQGDAKISSSAGILWISNIFPLREGFDTITAFFDNNDRICVTLRKCKIYATPEELEEYMKKRNADSKTLKEYALAMQLIKSKIGDGT